MTDHLQLAREHLANGERLAELANNTLAAGCSAASTDLLLFPDVELLETLQKWQERSPRMAVEVTITEIVALAQTHFMASMAHTNMLLADPPEAPEPAAT